MFCAKITNNIHNQYAENTNQVHNTTKALAIILKMCIMFYIRNTKKNAK